MNLRTITVQQKMVLFLGIFLGIIAVIIIAYLLAPTLVYDQWIWKYYWGPVVADASGHSVSFNGVTAQEGYTILSEITYGLILVCALYGLYKLLKKLEIRIDWYFCLALFPYILFGPVTRVLEDTNYFSEPAVYWFISPLIYFQTTLYVLIFLFLGYYLQKRAFNARKTLFILLSVFVLIDSFYTIIWALGIRYGASLIEPGFFYVLSILAFLPLLYRMIKKQMMTVNTVVFSGGLLVVLPCFFLIGRWIMGDQWSGSYGTYGNVFLLVIGLVFLIVLLVYLIAWVYRKHDTIMVYKNPLNLSMLAGHLIDGITSYVSIYDPLHMGLPSYVEKHPASNGLMELWPPLFPIVKFLLIIIVIYVFDVVYKKELGKYSRLVNLLKIGIFILGVSPGLRDLLRVTMGV
ncbi:MAG: DUF63 family protein [Thermoplasmata archaeon]|nr:DUF63 family protein [Thermoplasmata archaeon]MBE3137387.1 DUF63 family protein [Thermoplasmata archaeon]MBE3140942.1 DUF63 family protein [Thermoplasmata archaeon]